MDQIIPIKEGQYLFEACRDPKKAFLRAAAADYNEIQALAGASYFKRMQRLLSRDTG